MNDSELAQKMLDWEKKQAEADALKEEIAQEVLSRKKTFTVGNVTASYSVGRRTFGYEKAVHNFPETAEKTAAVIANTTRKTNWKKVCEQLKIQDVPVVKQSPAFISIKIKE